MHRQRLRTGCGGAAGLWLALAAVSGCQTAERWPSSMAPPPPRGYVSSLRSPVPEDQSTTAGASARDRGEVPALLVAAAADPGGHPAADARIVIYNAGLRIVVSDTEAGLKSIERMAVEAGGYMQEIKGERITVRVPAAQFDSVLARISALGRVSEREVQAEDVTEEYTDLELRLKHARLLRQRFEGLLEKAQSVADTLAIEKELSRITTEIEQLEGKLDVLRRRIAFSTISVTLESVAPAELGKAYRQLPFAWLRDLGIKSLFQ